MAGENDDFLPRFHAPAWECIGSMHHGENAEIRINSLPFTKRGLVDAVVIIFPAMPPPMKIAAYSIRPEY